MMQNLNIKSEMHADRAVGSIRPNTLEEDIKELKEDFNVNITKTVVGFKITSYIEGMEAIYLSKRIKSIKKNHHLNVIINKSVFSIEYELGDELVV